jgi:hypothetical protein
MSVAAGTSGRRGAARVAPHGRDPRLICRVRLEDGRVFAGELPAAKHRAIQLGMLLADSEGFVELTPGTRPPGGKVEVDRRKRPEHFLPGGASSDSRWLHRALRHCERILAGEFCRRRVGEMQEPREEVFVGVTPRSARSGNKEDVKHSRWLWIDIDDPDRLEGLYEFLAERPCQLLISSAGSGGMHAYWRLEQPLAATQVSPRTGELHEPIERANGRLICHLSGDPRCKDRSRVMRLLSVRRAIAVRVSAARSFADAASVKGRGGGR